MRFLTKLSAASFLLVMVAVLAFADNQPTEFNELLPPQIGEFRRLKPILKSELPSIGGVPGKHHVRPLSDGTPAAVAVTGEYTRDATDRVLVEVVRFRSDAEAYSFLTFATHMLRQATPAMAVLQGEIGSAGVMAPGTIAFFKGQFFVRVKQADSTQDPSDQIRGFAQALAAPLDPGDGELPVLIKHLPDWENAQQILHAVTLDSLKLVAPNQPVLDAVAFDAGAEAVAAAYGAVQMFIVEFNTPQIAGENDRRITAKLQELRDQGQSIPSAYRRIGNYSVFVFNASSQEEANELIGKVKYEQVVQWLGDDPYWLQRAERQYAETTASVLVVVVKAAGLALLICLGIGGFFGGLLFTHRRRRRPAEVFSDAGGMLRLNLDEMTPQTNPSRLIGRGN